MLNFDSSIPEEKRRSILFLVRTLDIGGAEKQMISLAERLKKEDDECHVFFGGWGGIRGAYEGAGHSTILWRS